MRKFLFACVMAVGLMGAPAVASAQSATYLHVAYAQQTCETNLRSTADATMMASVGAHVGYGSQGVWWNHVTNNTVDVTQRWWSTLANYYVDTTCRVVGSDAYSWVTGYTVGYVRRAP